MAAWAELGLGQTDAALKRLERAELAPLSFARWLYPIIDRLAQTGNPKRALALIDRALAKDQGVAAAHALRADILRQLGREDDYIAGLRDALKVDPGYYPARLELGVVLAQRGELVQAQEQLEAVLRQQPLNPRAHFNYATLLTQLGRWQEARRHFARALELDANYWKGYTALMATDLELGDRSAAAAVQVQLKKRCQEAEVLQEAEALMNPGGSAAP
jgi:tetratricopeptide (TPR) repeat protein